MYNCSSNVFYLRGYTFSEIHLFTIITLDGHDIIWCKLMGETKFPLVHFWIQLNSGVSFQNPKWYIHSGHDPI